MPEGDKPVKTFLSILSRTRDPVNGPQWSEDPDRPDGSKVDCPSRKLPVIQKSEESGHKISGVMLDKPSQHNEAV